MWIKTRDLQQAVTPQQVLQNLKDGHERACTGRWLTRDFRPQASATVAEQHPLAVVLSCVDTPIPAERVFELGMGDIFSVQIAGHVPSREVIGSVEFGCAMAGAKLIVVMGHTRCGVITTAVTRLGSFPTNAERTRYKYCDSLIYDLQRAVDQASCRALYELSSQETESLVNRVAFCNVERVVDQLKRQSRALDSLIRKGQIDVVGGMYDVDTGEVKFLDDDVCENREY